MGKIKKLFKNVTDKTKIAGDEIGAASQIVLAALEEMPDTLGPMKSAMRTAHGAYLEATVALLQCTDTLTELRKHFESTNQDVKLIEDLARTLEPVKAMQAKSLDLLEDLEGSISKIEKQYKRHSSLTL